MNRVSADHLTDQELYQNQIAFVEYLQEKFNLPSPCTGVKFEIKPDAFMELTWKFYPDADALTDIHEKFTIVKIPDDRANV